ncbi:dihydroneopterin aldolase [Brevibacillus composti]|uniref:7,8-dihydroneopterin aldolase n=1 Tax=Brevibacillus composti TaxID=2796470 RepID=A0A7T5EL68_9BACL|nr:dihydroneopterin aldolase [Brevibacillus composti]QQE74633.1 dihydroneopterin aldolase [Brevibacillus composti]QUO41717.1 dihydroneopterin aldolase [Brevibacillus composti]
MDKIYFEKMSFYGYHGVFEAEAQLGQRFYVDLEISLDLAKAGASDDLNDTVNYADIFHCVQQIVEKERFNLVEALTAQIASRLLQAFPFSEVKVKVTKPNPPIHGHYDAVAIEMIRKREDIAP